MFGKKKDISFLEGLKNINFRKKTLSTEVILVMIIMLMFFLLLILSDNFLTSNNIYNLMRQVSIIGIVSIGMTFVIISGGIDLSVGSVVGLSGVIAAILMKSGVNIFLSVIIALIIGAIVGLANGIAVHDGKVPPFIVTLGTMVIVRGAIMLVSNARMIAGLPETFTDFAQKSFLLMPSLFVVLILIVILTSFITNKTIFGRNLYAVGSNTEAARLSGINIRMSIYGTYIICALLSAIAGILMTSRLGNGIPTAGSGYELDAIAAAVIGGASLSGAEGTIIGTVLGAFIMGILRNGGNLLGMNPFILDISIGLLIIIAVLIDKQKRGK
jgi:ribose/xylose/arabinose/galactoside ABC-type transport system permease subunit